MINNLGMIYRMCYNLSIFQHIFFKISHWEMTNRPSPVSSWYAPPRLYIYEGGSSRLTPYIFASHKPSRIPFIKGNAVIVQFRQGSSVVSSFKIEYMAYSARPESSEYVVATGAKGKLFKTKHFSRHHSHLQLNASAPTTKQIKKTWKTKSVYKYSRATTHWRLSSLLKYSEWWKNQKLPMILISRDRFTQAIYDFFFNKL